MRTTWTSTDLRGSKIEKRCREASEDWARRMNINDGISAERQAQIEEESEAMS
jgi:hypothetical protein